VLFIIPKIRKELINLDVYLIDESTNYTFQFPVNPLDKISKQKEKRFITADVIDIGEVDISQKGSKIIEINFNSFFPLEYDSFCRFVSIMKPSEYVEKIESWINNDVHLRLIITDLNINELVNISKFTPEVRGGEVEDVYFSITFRTYKELKIETVNNTANTNIGGLDDNRETKTSNFSPDDIVTVTASALNVRDGPGTDKDILGSVYKGDTLTLYRIQGNWADTYWGDHGGWVCLDYVTK
jgi:hypothetical protein